MKQIKGKQQESKFQRQSLRSLPRISLSQTRITTAFETDREPSEDTLSAQILRWKTVIKECVQNTKETRGSSQEIFIRHDTSIRQNSNISIDTSFINPSAIVEQYQGRMQSVKEVRRSRFNSSNPDIKKPYDISGHVNFEKTSYQFQAFTSEKKASELRVKDNFASNVKRSTNIILKSILEEFNSLVNQFQQLEITRRYFFSDHQRDLVTQIPGQIGLLLPMKNLQTYEVEDLFKEIVETLTIKSCQLKDNLYDVLKFVFRALCDKIVNNTRSLNLFIQAYFIFSIVQESFGRVQEAISTLCFIDDTINGFKLIKPKLVLLNRMAICLNRQGNQDTSLMISTKQLLLSWYFNDKEFELKSYLNMYQTEMARGNITNAQILHEKYIDHEIQEDGYVKQLGIKYISASLQRLILSQMLGSQENRVEFDLSLILKIKTPKEVQFFPKKHIQLHLVGDKKGLKNYPRFVKNQKVETNKKEFNRKRCVEKSHFSPNRNYANFFNDRSNSTNNIQTIYKPERSVPILLKLIDEFKQNYQKLLQQIQSRKVR